MNHSAGHTPFLWNSTAITRRATGFLLFLAFAVGLLLAAVPARAQTNLLANPIFSVPPIGRNVPSDWTFFAPPAATAKDYWVVNQGTAGDSNYVEPIAGTTDWWKQWNALGATNVAGIYQTVGTAPGSIYQADGWMVSAPSDVLGASSYAWLQVEFLDSNSNLLSLYKSALFTGSVGTAAYPNDWFFYQATNACDVTQPGIYRRSVFHHLRQDRRGQPVGGSAGNRLVRLPLLLLLPGIIRGRLVVFRRRGSGTNKRPGSAGDQRS